MRPIHQNLLFSVFLASALAACGGGGGGGGSASAPTLSNIPWVVNAAAARQAVTGSQALTLTHAEAVQKIQAIQGDSNTLLTGDFLQSGLPLPPRFSPNCSGTICTYTILGRSVSVSISNAVQFDLFEIQPVMMHNGVSIAQLRARDDAGTDDQSETLTYGGWLEHNAFAVEVLSSPSVASPREALIGTYSYGNSPGTNPADVTGRTATWKGAVVGADLSTTPQTNAIHGTATVEVDFSSSNVDVTFSNLIDLNSPGRSLANMGWTDLPLSGGKFSDGSGANQIRGSFYGPSHEEVGGVFERNQILGAFGAVRGSAP